MLRYIAKGKEEGARVLCGGDVLKGDGFDNGAWVAPTVFTDRSDDMTIVREDIFGPVMSILTYESEDEVIRRANDTDYGLAAGIVTADLNRAHRVIHQLEGYLLDQHLGRIPGRDARWRLQTLRHWSRERRDDAPELHPGEVHPG